MPKRRGKSAASKHQKTPKSEIKETVLIGGRYVDGATRSKTDDERFWHNKKKLERALNAKIICKENDKEEQDDGEAIMKKLDKWCKDNTNYTRGMKIVFSSYVL